MYGLFTFMLNRNGQFKTNNSSNSPSKLDLLLFVYPNLVKMKLDLYSIG